MAEEPLIVPTSKTRKYDEMRLVQEMGLPYFTMSTCKVPLHTREKAHDRTGEAKCIHKQSPTVQQKGDDHVQATTRAFAGRMRPWRCECAKPVRMNA